MTQRVWNRRQVEHLPKDMFCNALELTQKEVNGQQANPMSLATLTRIGNVYMAQQVWPRQKKKEKSDPQ